MGPGKTDCLPNQNYNSTKALNCIRAIYKMIKKTCRRTWHFTRMSKKSSSGSLLSSVIRRPSTGWWWLCVRRSPGRLLKLALWSSKRRLWELASRSKNSSVLGDTTATAGAVNREKSTHYKNIRACLLSAWQILSALLSPVPLLQQAWSHRWEDGIPQGSRWCAWWLFRLDYTSLDLTPTQNVLLQHTGLDLEGSFSRLNPGWMGQCFYSIPWKGTI